MEQLVIAALGAFAGWVFLRMLLPFRIPDRLAPLIIGGLAFGVLSIPDRKAQLAVAAVAGASLIHNVLRDSEVPGNWRLPRVRLPARPRRSPPSQEPEGTGHRVAGGPGRRIPLI